MTIFKIGVEKRLAIGPDADGAMNVVLRPQVKAAINYLVSDSSIALMLNVFETNEFQLYLQQK